jgi:hypothetical protein
VDQAHRDITEEGGPDGAAFRGMARPSRRTPAVVALASLAVLAVALLTRQPDPAADVPTAVVSTAEVSAQPQRAEAIASSPGPVVAPSPTPAPPSLNPAVTPRPTAITAPTEPGTIQLRQAGSGLPRIDVVLGGGWMRATDGTIGKATGASPSRITIGAWSLRSVHVFPCRWSAGDLADAQLMRTAEGQAQALASWWGQDPGMPPDSNAPIAPIATRPQSTTLAGYPAWSLEMLIPSDFDMAACDGGQLILWESTTGDVRFGLGPGELVRLWVVDVDGRPILIEGSTFLAQAPDDRAELDAIIRSLVVVTGVG